MTRGTRIGWGAAGLAFVGTLLLLAPSASAAAAPPFVATPSYAPFGGLHFLGTHVLSASGTGANTVPKGPAFLVATGHDFQLQGSRATTSGTYGVYVWSGVQNVSFTCPASCPSGPHAVTISWTATWAALVNTTCPQNPLGATIMAWANLSLFANVIDWSTSPVTVAGSAFHNLFDHALYAPGQVVVTKTAHPYTVAFNANLVSGDSYTVTAWFYALTYANAAAPPGSVCSSVATAGTGIAHPTILHSIKVA